MTTATKTATKIRTKVLSSGAAVGMSALALQSSAGQVVLRKLSDPALKPDIARLKEKLRNDPKFALATLQSAGIATPSGKLSKRFKG